MNDHARESATGDASIDVHYVAHLARMTLTDDEAALFQRQLNGILDYVAALRELDLKDIEPTAHATPLQNVFREDAPAAGLDREDVMKNAPAPRNGQFAVPVIIE